jgi:hypothetical protein
LQSPTSPRRAFGLSWVISHVQTPIFESGVAEPAPKRYEGLEINLESTMLSSGMTASPRSGKSTFSYIILILFIFLIIYNVNKRK